MPPATGSGYGYGHHVAPMTGEHHDTGVSMTGSGFNGEHDDHDGDNHHMPPATGSGYDHHMAPMTGEHHDTGVSMTGSSFNGEHHDGDNHHDMPAGTDPNHEMGGSHD